MLFEKQPHQIDCVDNLLEALNGVNLADIDTHKLKNNLINTAAKLKAPQLPYVDDKHLDVMMETGTGKTFVYLQTIFELSKHHQQQKFVIIVPRTAIKLGVIQQINQTREYFFNIYKKHLNYINYPEDGLDVIQQDFINSKDLSVLLITNSSFNKKSNKINSTAERPLQGVLTSTWQAVCDKKPVVIIDEPHLLKGNKTTEYISMIDGLTIRFGATFPGKLMDHSKPLDGQEYSKERYLSNVSYCLDSISAFNNYLVKKIRVNTVFVTSEESALQIHNIVAKKSFDAYYNINEQLYQTKVYLHDDLGAKTGLEKYNGASVTKISSSKVYLNKAQEMEVTKDNYQLSDAEITNMIEQTIRLHFKKEEGLFNKGIKALSLFFIPSVNDFRGDDPQVKNIFEEKYKKIRQEFYDKTKNSAYKKYLQTDYNDKGELQVHEGYFSGDKAKTNEEKEADGINTILNDKEGLLSFTKPLRFVFSVWALQEGWDNPNIFTICKLSNTSKETSRRQQVGRGLRIAVNQKGKRITYGHMKEQEDAFYAINTLDILVSSQEQGFIYQIQNEIMENSFSIVGGKITLDILKDKGLTDNEASLIYYKLSENNIIDDAGNIMAPVSDFMSDNQELFSKIAPERYREILKLFQKNKTSVEDANSRPKTVKVRKEQWDEFKNLWESINKQREVTYAGIQQRKLVNAIVKKFNKLDIKPYSSRVTTETLQVKTKNNGLDSKSKEMDVVRDPEATYNLPNDYRYYAKQPLGIFIKEVANDERLPLSFLCSLFSKLNVQYFKNNPAKARNELIAIIQSEIHDTILQHVSYQFSQTTILANSLQEEDGSRKEKINYSELGRFYSSDDEPGEKFLYDTVVYDSVIEKDVILKDSTGVNDKEITVFAKLPKIGIPTPYKTYTPDFAYLIKVGGRKELFLIVETKGYDREDNIPEEEKKKIKYAHKFFEYLEMQMKQSNPDFTIRFRSRVNKEELSHIITDTFADIS